MKIGYILIILITIQCSIVYASHSHETQCSITVDGQFYPVIYQGQERNNPDKTMYPGDAAYYLFKFKGDDTCKKFHAESIKTNGAVNLVTHHIVMGQNDNINKKIHQHYNQGITAKYLKTTHYYEILETETSCIVHRGGNRSCTTENSLAASPTVSIREDQRLTQRQKDSITNSPTCYFCKDFQKKETYEWGFTQIGTQGRYEGVVYADADSKENFERIVANSCSNLDKNQGCAFGHAEISPEIIKRKCLFDELSRRNISHGLNKDVCVSVSDSLSLTVKGIKIRCDEKCRQITVQKTKTLISHILEPKFDIQFEKISLRDNEKFIAKNIDDTYYLYDPIGIKHDPKLKWKEVRDKTIQFETIRHHELKKELQWDCKENDCIYTVNHHKVYPDNIPLENGQGVTIYNATANTDIKNQKLEYEIIVYNLGRKISVTHDTTEAEIVKYNPKYSSYPYPLLSDNSEYAFDDRQAVALYYHGNQNDEKISKEQRSKINYFWNFGVGYDPFHPQSLNQNFTYSDVVDFSESIESHNDTILFLKEGYASLYFEYPLGDIVWQNGIPRYENVTTFTTIYSKDFAAKDTVLQHYSFRYPEAPFAKNLIIQSINQQGEIIPEDITLEVKPYSIAGIEYISKYIFEKVQFDTDDENFAKIISNETYPMLQKFNGNGMLNATIFKTPIFFDEVTQQKDSGESFTGKLSDIASLTKNKLRLSMPFDIGLSSLSPTTLQITVNENTVNFDERYYSYGGKQKIMINTQKDNVLQVERSIGKIILHPPKNFGTINTVYVDGIMVKQECSYGCILLFQPEKDLQIKVENRWGGIATNNAKKIPIISTPIKQEPNYQVLAAIILTLLLAWYVLSKFRVKK